MTGRGWIHHPITKMWEGHEDALGVYMNACIDEWERRGFRNNMLRYNPLPNYSIPTWIGDKDFHKSHRENLLRKDFSHYSKYFIDDKPGDKYVWKNEGKVL